MSSTIDQSIKKEINIFSNLGKLFAALSKKEPWPGFDIGLAEDEYNTFLALVENVKIHNPWFTEDNVSKSLHSWSTCLEEQQLTSWVSQYPRLTKKPENVALILAGNIPLVGMHDLLSVLFAGHNALLKLSSDDDKLLPKVIETLTHWDPSYKERIHLVTGKLENFDRVIATGSNNTSRYFDYYFGKVPNIIRKNRSSIAILTGKESKDELNELGKDIFSYFGLGCRNVSKIYLPKGYELSVFFNGIFGFSEIVNHNKYANNYDYNKAVWLLNEDNILDNGFILLKESEELSAPTASLYFEYYEDYATLISDLAKRSDEIQCIVSHNHIAFGDSQAPNLSDYADGVDTMKFLTSSF